MSKYIYLSSKPFIAIATSYLFVSPKTRMVFECLAFLFGDLSNVKSKFWTWLLVTCFGNTLYTLWIIPIPREQSEFQVSQCGTNVNMFWRHLKCENRKEIVSKLNFWSKTSWFQKPERGNWTLSCFAIMSWLARDN